MNKELLLIFDFDDTLVKTCIEFDKTNLETVQIVNKAIYGKENKINEILDYQRKIDFKLISTYGFVPKRFVTSWLDTYEYFAKLEGLPILESIRQNITDTVNDVFYRKYENLPGIHEALEVLKNEGYKMIILTAGIEEIQNRKIKEAGVRQYMDEIYVRANKTPEVFKSIMELHDAREYVMIGNSLKSDIHPALSNGAWGVHIERETWAADHYEIDSNHEKYIHLNSISNLPTTIQSIQESISEPIHNLKIS